MNKRRSKYSAFTLIEMLVVLAIFTILFGIGISAFSGLRTTILMNQTTENLKQNFRWAQRASILLKRDPAEYWLYGIGIDLSQFYGEDGTYRVFKWCAPFREYSDDERAWGEFPNHIDGSSGDISNGDTGNLPFHNGYYPIGYSTPIWGPYYVEDCSPSTMGGVLGDDGALAEIGNKGVGLIDNFDVPAPLASGYLQEITPRFIVYESVSGNVFFYDEDGYLMNYVEVADGVYRFVDDPVDLDFVIKTPNGDRGINMIMSGRSGKLINMNAVDDPEDTYTFHFRFVAPVAEGADMGLDEVPDVQIVIPDFEYETGYEFIDDGEDIQIVNPDVQDPDVVSPDIHFETE